MFNESNTVEAFLRDLLCGDLIYSREARPDFARQHGNLSGLGWQYLSANDLPRQTHEVMVEALVRERILVGEGITAQRVATIDAITPLMQEAIDQAFWRATQLLIAVALFAVLLVGLVTFALLRRSRSAGP